MQAINIEDMTAQDIHTLLARGERLTLECKRAKGGIPHSLWETYSAFANTDGGTILLGIEENQGTYTIAGLDDAEKMRRDVWNLLNDTQKVNINLLHDSDVEIVPTDGVDILAIHVPRADYLQRPVYIHSNMQRGTFKRNHEGDYHCSDAELRMMLRDANEQGNDRLFLEYYTMDDIDIPSLERYRQLFKIDHPEHIWNTLDNKDFLMQLGGYMVNRQNGSEGLTMAGLLMFGKGLPVRERFDNLRMDFIDYTNLIGEQRYSNRITYDGTWENNLFNFIRMVVPLLTNTLPRPFAMEGVIRKDDTLQHKAVREAVTNAIIHADFMQNGLLKIEKFNTKFVLTNPGLLKLPLAQIYAGGESKARNQRMQAMLRMIGYGENLGSGFPLILTAWNEQHWLRPELTEQPELMQVKLTLHIENRAKDSEETGQVADENVVKESPLGGIGGGKHGGIDYTANMLVTLLKANNRLTTQEIANNLNISKRQCERIIAKLKQSGRIQRVGNTSASYWVIAE